MEKKIRMELNKKSTDLLKKYKFIGAEIKSSRLKLSKTLDSIDNVNKSISYISKIENNKIIPNERSLKELCDELLIRHEDLDNMSKFDECILEAIDAIYMLDYEKMETLYKIYSSFTNIRTNLMKGLYYFMFNKHKELKDVIESLEKIEGSLSIEDYLVYVLICVKNLMLDKKTIQAYKILKIVLSSDTARGTILCVFNMMSFDIKTQFHIYNFKEEYFDIIQMHVSRNNIKRIEEVIKINEKQKVELLSFENDEENIETIKDDGLKLYAYCLINETKKASEIFNDDIDDEYKLFYFYKTKQQDLIDTMIANSMNEENMILANSYKFELDNNIDVYRNYLINICVPYYKEIAKISKLIYFSNILVALNTKVAKYKDSVSIANDVLKTIEEITKIII